MQVEFRLEYRHLHLPHLYLVLGVGIHSHPICQVVPIGLILRPCKIHRHPMQLYRHAVGKHKTVVLQLVPLLIMVFGVGERIAEHTTTSLVSQEQCSS